MKQKLISAALFAATLMLFTCNPAPADNLADVVHHYYRDTPNMIWYTLSTNEPIEDQSTPNTLWAFGLFQRIDPNSSADTPVVGSSIEHSVVEFIDARGYASSEIYSCTDLSLDQPFDTNRSVEISLRITATGDSIEGKISIGDGPILPVTFIAFTNGLREGHLLIGKFGLNKSIVISLYSSPPIPN